MGNPAKDVEDSSNQDALHEVEQFVDRLAALSQSEWLSAAEIATDDSQARAEPIRRLEQIVSESKLTVDAWLATEGVASAAHAVFVTAKKDCLQKDELVARRAAEIAAHAILAKSFLEPREFRTLCLPFEDLISPAK